MPTYEYACSACGHELEVFQSMKDDPLRKCPKCRKLKLSRKIGLGAGVIFKGSGFYETDYKKEAPKKEGEAKPEKSEAAKESKPAETKASGEAKKSGGSEDKS